jgi:hypothetical protein
MRTARSGRCRDGSPVAGYSTRPWRINGAFEPRTDSVL